MPNRRTWGVDRSINPVYVGLLLTLLIGILAWAGGPGGVNPHFSTHDAALVQQAKDIELIRKENETFRRETLENQKSINEKLDRLIERRR